MNAHFGINTNGLLNTFPWNIDITFANNIAVYDNELKWDCSGMNGNLVLPETAERFWVKDNNHSGIGGANFNGHVTFPNGVTNLEHAFYQAPLFSQPLDLPHTVTDCWMMFDTNFNAPVNFHDCHANVTNMFYATAMNSPVNLGNAITDCNSMFALCVQFNKPVTIPDSVVSANSMFLGCTSMNSPVTLGNNLQSATSMLKQCYYYNHPVTLPPTLVNSQSMFDTCVMLNQPVTIPASVTNMVNMFRNCRNLNCKVTVQNVDVNIDNAFCNCQNMSQDFTVPAAITDKYKIEHTFTGCWNYDKASPTINVPSHFYGTDAVTYWAQNARNCINWY